jgi:SAM-dependent methyltransferase
VTEEAASYWDDVAELWLRERPQSLWRRHSDAVNHALLARWLPPRSGRLLKTDLFDEIVGTGLYPFLASRADQVVGIDVSAKAARAAADRHPGLRTACADVRELPFADGEFDAVVSNSTLDHLDSELAIGLALRELRRVLRPGGELVLTLDNPTNPVIALRRALPPSVFERVWRGREKVAVRLLPSPVGATCTAGRACSLLEATGFDVLDTGAAVHCPRALAIVVADALERHAGEGVQDAYLRALMSFETLGKLPTRYLTGYFVAVHARRR